jgi:hypothetical protein
VRRVRAAAPRIKELVEEEMNEGADPEAEDVTID